MKLNFRLIQQLRPQIEPFLRRTPIVRAPWNHRLLLKLECLQHTGSFKIRGPLGIRATTQDSRRWATASAGNHGLGVAFACRNSSRPPKIFVPQTSAQVKRDKIIALGAEIQVLPTSSYDETEEYALNWCRRNNGLFVSPFDHPIIMAGNGGTLGLEILEQLPTVRTILVPVGGGGLSSGLACAVRTVQSKVRIIGVQSEETSSMFDSLHQGKPVASSTDRDTLAEGLEGGVSQASFEYSKRWLDDLVLVSEEMIARAMLAIDADLQLRVEGSAAVVVAHAMQSMDKLESPVCAILTGRNVDSTAWDRAKVLSGLPQ